MYYIFDNIEIIMGSYETWKQAQDDLDMHRQELYLDLYYPEPYIDYLADEFEDHIPDNDVKRERIIRRRIN